MTREEDAVLEVLRAEHDAFARELATWTSGVIAPGAIRGLEPPEPILLSLDRVTARSGLHRRAARRALERLAASGKVTRCPTSDVQWRLSTSETVNNRMPTSDTRSTPE